MTPQLDKPVTRLRAAVARGLAQREKEPVIDREGGDYGAGIIRGVAMTTRGEALGHGLWLDADFVESVVTAANEARDGLKARFTHPGLSSDGLGRFLGRMKNATRTGDVARGDLHLAKSAHETPDGDLAEYVMRLAEEDPEAFGTSIVFESDRGAELAFEGEHTDEEGRFKSPDEDNVNNLRHARLHKLYADDIVDEPAANPGGLFHRGDEIAKEADDLLAYALGLTEHKPELCALDIEPDRVAGFVTRFMAAHGLEVKHMGKPEDQAKPTDELAKTKAQDEEDEDEEEMAEDEDEKKDEMSRFRALKSAFPKESDFVVEMFDAGRSVTEAQTEWDRRELAKLREEVKALRSARTGGGVRAAAFAAPDAADTGGDFMEQARKLAADSKIPLHQAMSRVAREKPELHAAYVESCRR